jgi:hypothetical protein
MSASRFWTITNSEIKITSPGGGGNKGGGRDKDKGGRGDKGSGWTGRGGRGNGGGGGGVEPIIQPTCANIKYQPDHGAATTDNSLAIFDLALGGTGNPHTFTYGANAHNDTGDTALGLGGSSFKFDGTDDGLLRAYHVDFVPESAETKDTAEFCFEMHVKFAALTASQIIFSRFATTGDGRVWLLHLDGASHIQFVGWDSGTGGSEFVDITTTATIDINEWHHVAVTRENGFSATVGQEDIIRIFLDGVMSASAQIATADGFHTDPEAGPGFGDSEAATVHMNGAIDNVRIVIGEPLYIVDFTPPVARHPQCPADLLYVEFLYDFEDITEPSPTEESTNERGMFKTGGTSDATRKLFAKNTMNLPSSVRQDVVGSGNAFEMPVGDATIEGWVYVSGVYTGEKAFTALYNTTGAKRNWRFFLRADAVGGQATFVINPAGGSSAGTYTVGPAIIPKDEWVHLCYQRRGDTHTVFMNGEPGTPTSTADRPSGAGSDAMTFSNTLSGAQGFIGNLAEWRFTMGVARYPDAGFTVPTGPFQRPA